LRDGTALDWPLSMLLCSHDGPTKPRTKFDAALRGGMKSMTLMAPSTVS
jgi:hypothetical protein